MTYTIQVKLSGRWLPIAYKKTAKECSVYVYTEYQENIGENTIHYWLGKKGEYIYPSKQFRIIRDEESKK